MANSKSRKPQVSSFELYAKRKAQRLLLNKKAASVVLSTVVLTAGVIAMGIAVLYWTQSMGKIGNLEYSKSTKASINAVEERIGFEYISYSSTSKTVTVNIINWGKADNISIARVYVLDTSYSHVAVSNNVALKNITNNNDISGNILRLGCEGYFTITTTLASNSMYYVRIVTDRGRNFDGSFATPPL
jgi:uncharacterized membrane protein